MYYLAPLHQSDPDKMKLCDFSDFRDPFQRTAISKDGDSFSFTSPFPVDILLKDVLEQWNNCMKK